MDVTRMAIEQFLRFVLTTARVSGLFLMAPMLSDGGVPRRVKIGLAAIVGLIVFPVLPPASARFDVGGLTLAGFVVVLVAELAVGLVIGLLTAIVMAGIEMAGLFVGQQTGVALANVINPLSGSSVSVMGRFYSYFALVVFLTIGGHRLLVAAILKSFLAVPIGGLRFTSGLAEGVAALSGQMFVIAVTISAPVVLALVLATLALGLVARTVPQLNILAIGFPLRIGLGWTVAMLSLAAVAVLSRDLFLRMFEDMGALIELM